jgi:hypothetical protein
VTRHLVIAFVVAAAAIALALASGIHRRPALIGATSSSFTAVGSLLAMARFARAGTKPVQAALGVMAVAFLVRIVLVGLGTALVVRSSENVIAFVVAFFVPYFAFSAIEAAYLHSLRSGTGPTA